MKYSPRTFSLFVLAFAILTVLARAQQTSFSAEDEIERPVVVPEGVLQVLRRDKRNRTCLAENQTPKDIPASWFAASEIDLNNDGLIDLIVTAKNPCLFGANINPFWVFRKTRRGHSLTLSISTLALEILRPKTNGHRNIRVSAVAAGNVVSILYKFDGARYRMRRRTWKPI